MPKRKTVKRFETDEVQGEGSYVVISGVKVREIREARSKTDDPNYDDMEFGLSMLTDHILEWNWVDDLGNPLPLPSERPEVIDELTTEESEYLAELLVGSEAAKN